MIKKLLNQYKHLSVGAKAALWYTIANIMYKGINVFVVPLYTRMLTTAQYGTYTVFMSWTEIFEILVTFRLFQGAYIVGLVKFDDDRETYTSSLEQLSFFITTVCLILYLFLQKFINEFTGMNTTMTLMMFGMMYAVPVIGFWRTWKRTENKYVAHITVSLVIALLVPAFGLVGILLFNGSEQSVIFSRVIVDIGVAVFLLVTSLSWFTKKPDAEYWKYALRMNIPLIPYYLSKVILNHSDRIVIQKFAGYSEAGIYSVAYSVAMLMTWFTHALNMTLQPWLYKEIKKKNYQGIPGILVFALLLVAVLIVILIALAPEVISFMAPAQYHEAIYIIPPLAASVFVMFFYQNFVNVEFYYNESWMTSVASIGSGILNVVLNVLLIPRFGYLVAGYTTLISYLAFLVTHLFFVIRVCRKNDCPIEILGLKQMFLISVVFTGVCIAMTFGYHYNIIRYIMILLICAVIFIKRDLLKNYLESIMKNRKKSEN